MADVKGQDITNKLATQSQAPKMTVAQFFEREIPNIAAVMPKNAMDPTRMAKLAIQIWTGNPKLAACDKNSFIAALLTCAQFGLEPNTPLGQAHIIPYGNKATFQLGYQGLIDLANRTGEFKEIYTYEVYKNDEFRYSLGLHRDLIHVPDPDGPADGELPTHIYAVYHLLNGGYGFECWSWNKIIKHAQTFSKSYSKPDGQWRQTPVAMGKKTLIKAVLKYAPKSLEIISKAMEYDETTQAAPEAKREYMEADYTINNEVTEPAEAAPAKTQDAPAVNADDPALEFEKAMGGKK